MRSSGFGKLWVVLGFFFGMANTFAADLPGLTRLFAQTFESGYRAGYCGINVMELLTLAQREGVDTADASILYIEDVNASWFGMVNAEMAREQGRRILPVPAQGPRYEVGEKNWYHHVVLLAEGSILDFDFTNEPQVLPVDEYFERMFLDESRNAPGDIKFVGREKKLSGYRITEWAAEDYLAREQGAPAVEKSISFLAEFLDTH